MKLIYIAAPFTIGDNAMNIRIAMDMAERIYGIQQLPFNPLLINAHFIVYPTSWDTAMDRCFKYIEHCDLMIRIPGKSKGADAEVKYAESIGLEVFYNFCTMENWLAKQQQE